MKNFHLTNTEYEEIKRAVGMRQAAEYYGYRVDGRGNCLCPFHKDRHPSMKIYPHNRGYYCFSCGAGGDVIKFAARLFGLNNESAARKIIEDFALPIRTEGLSYREKRERELAARRHNELRKFVYYAGAILGLYRMRLCEAIRSPGSAHFVEGLQMLSITDYRLECLLESPQEVYRDQKVVKWIGTVEQRLIEWDAAACEKPASAG